MEFMFLVAQKVFENESYVSTGMLQRFLKLSYYEARAILDKMIRTGFCEPQVGARPCKILHLVN